jgi:REP element-mobilizing transposase RayT
MPDPKIPLTPNNYYHVYNRGINSCNIFNEEKDYLHFLKLYEKYVHPIADTLAWVLMKNHLHFLIRIKSGVVYKYSMEELDMMSVRANANRSADAVGLATKEAVEFAKWETTGATDLSTFATDLSAFGEPDGVCTNNSHKENKTPNPSSHLSHLFNAYAKYFNLKYNRHGSLFERAFKRKHVNNEAYLKQVIIYIHNNPVHHGFCSHPLEYPWSSYLSCISEGPTKLNRSQIMNWFGDRTNFKLMHENNSESKTIESWLDL